MLINSGICKVSEWWEPQGLLGEHQKNGTGVKIRSTWLAAVYAVSYQFLLIFLINSEVLRSSTLSLITYLPPFPHTDNALQADNQFLSFIDLIKVKAIRNKANEKDDEKMRQKMESRE